MSTSLQQISKFEQILIAAKDQLSSLLDKNVNTDKFIGSVLATVAKDTKIQNCTPESILEACYDAASLGLAIDARNLAYIVAYGNKAKLMPSYKGMVELALKSGVVVNIFAEVVFANDKFKYEAGTIQTIEHVPAPMDKPRGNFIGAYAVARFANGIIHPCVMRLDEITKVRNKSRSSGSGPWVSDFEEMAKKTVVRRLFKMLPSNVMPTDAYRIDNEHFDFSNKTTGENEAVNVEGDSTKEETVTHSEEEKEESAMLELLNRIHILVGYNAALQNLPVTTFEEIQKKYRYKNLTSLQSLLEMTERKLKPALVTALYRSQQAQKEVNSIVAINEELTSANDPGALELSCNSLWAMYLDSKRRLEEFLHNDSKHGELSFNENKSHGR